MSSLSEERCVTRQKRLRERLAGIKKLWILGGIVDFSIFFRQYPQIKFWFWKWHRINKKMIYFHLIHTTSKKSALCDKESIRDDPLEKWRGGVRDFSLQDIFIYLLIITYLFIYFRSLLMLDFFWGNTHMHTNIQYTYSIICKKSRTCILCSYMYLLHAIFIEYCNLPNCKIVTLSIWRLPQLCSHLDITNGIHWTIRLTELMSSHFTPDG